jgi:hypothetical protein
VKSPPFGPPWQSFERDSSGVFSSIICNGLQNLQPYAINDNGTVTGTYMGGSTPEYFLANPVPGLAQFSDSVSSIAFGVVPWNQSSAPVPVVITNSGNARMDLGPSRFRGYLPPDSSPSFTASACMSQGVAVTSLDPGASCVINVAEAPSIPFTPPPGAMLSDILVIYDSAPGSPQLIPVSATVATGTPPPPPFCSTGTLSPGPSRQISFTFSGMSAAGTSGLQSIVLLNSTNVSAPIPTFTIGTTGPITVNVVQIDPQQFASVQFQVTNAAGGTAMCGTQIYGGANQWTGTGVTSSGKVNVLPDSSRNVLHAFVRGTNGNLLHSSETAPGGPWSAWENLGGVLISDPEVIINAFSGFDVYAVGTDNAVWHTWQTSPGSPWTGWASIGGSVLGDLSVLVSGSQAQVFARGSDSALWYNSQAFSSGAWSGWISLGGYILSSPAAGTWENGVSVLAVGGDQALWHIDSVQQGSSNWSQWQSLGGGPFTGTPLVTGGAIQLEVFIGAPDGSVWRNTQASVPAGTGGLGIDPGWNGWTSLGGYFTGNIAAASGAGGVQIFGRGGDNALWYATESYTGGPVSGWASLGGVLAADVAAAVDSQFRVEVLARAPDGSLWGIAQVAPGDWF